MELEVPVGLPEVSVEFAARRLGLAEEPEVVGVEVAEEPAEEFAGELAVESGVELVADQSAESAVGSAADLEVAHLG